MPFLEQTGPQTFPITQACAGLQGGLPPQTSVVTWTISVPTRFEMRSEDGRESGGGDCEPSQRPVDWQDNDISAWTP